MPSQESPRKQDADQLYEQYGRPLEEKHRGQYVAISPEGQTVLGDDLLEALEKAEAVFGPGRNLVFKIGDKVVGKWR
ncbi:MAG TPA: DUF5678 domain-containing protein [Chloroflexota bacterium]|nr:DUF5678 domain-containing protein [Chloroflexota bacterium]